MFVLLVFFLSFALNFVVPVYCRLLMRGSNHGRVVIDMDDEGDRMLDLFMYFLSQTNVVQVPT
jgi:hypothetical protein